jgi:NTP pyrophosphatase (non-canonical NTP hydrolase)
MSDIANLQNRALEVQARYSKFNAGKGHGSWGAKEYAMGLVGDIGDLLKLVMAKENLRSGEDVDIRLCHELSDCLWSIFIIASKYDINLEKSFLATMDELDQRLDGVQK